MLTLPHPRKLEISASQITHCKNKVGWELPNQFGGNTLSVIYVLVLLRHFCAPCMPLPADAPG